MVREDIPVTFLNSEEKPIEAFSFELNFHKKKWLVCCSYNPNRYNLSIYFDTLRKGLDLYLAHYKITILLGDFNLVSMIHVWNLSVNCVGLEVI